LLLIGFSFRPVILNKSWLEDDYATHVKQTKPLKEAGVSNEHYITALYVCSLLANLPHYKEKITIILLGFSSSFTCQIILQTKIVNYLRLK
jgi:hypothetical protein